MLVDVDDMLYNNVSLDQTMQHPQGVNKREMRTRLKESRRTDNTSTSHAQTMADDDDDDDDGGVNVSCWMEHCSDVHLCPTSKLFVLRVAVVMVV